MIADPPLLTIRARFPAPGKRNRRGFRRRADRQCRRRDGRRRRARLIASSRWSRREVMVGVAVTCNCGPGRQSRAVRRAVDRRARRHPGRGDRRLQGRGGDRRSDARHGAQPRRRGLRDRRHGARHRSAFSRVGLPVYCAGVTPNSPVRNGPGTVGEPVDLGGLRIESGDILIGDRDGVVVVPRLRAEAVLAALSQVREAEAALEAKVKAGLEIPDFVRAILESDRVRKIG